MTDAWRIDSIDARAGLAFASWRSADLDSKAIDLEKPTLFLSPPYFQPEAVASRATAFAAARGQAQLGVFVEGAELTFETVEHIAEFVRRAYVGSGSGDLGGGTDGPPPSPDEPPPGIPPGGIGIVEAELGEHPVLSAVRRLANMAADLGFQAGTPTKTLHLNLDGRTAERVATTSSVLVDGATETVLELLRRFPLHLDQAALDHWLRSAQTVGAAISRLDLWGDILDGHYAKYFDHLLPNIIPATRDMPVRELRYLLPLLFASDQASWYFRTHDLAYLRYLYRHGVYFRQNSAWCEAGDPVDHLSMWPLPKEIRTMVHSSQSDPSAFALTCAVNANPIILAETSLMQAKRAWSIMHFAAAYLWSESQPPPRSSWLLSEGQRGVRQSLMRESGNWLLQQWPKLIFPKPVELAIRAAMEIDLVSKESAIQA